MEQKNEIVKDVVEQVVNMLLNNVIEDNGTECFECWCEDGAVFGDEDVDISAQVAIMRKLAPYVDALSNAIENELV